MNWGRTTTEIRNNKTFGYERVSNDCRPSSTLKAKRKSIDAVKCCHRRKCFDNVEPNAYGYQTAVPSSPLSSPQLTEIAQLDGQHSLLSFPNKTFSTLHRRASVGHTSESHSHDHRRVVHRASSLTSMIERPTHILKQVNSSERSHVSAFSSTGWTVSSQQSIGCFTSTGWSVEDGSDATGSDGLD